MRTIDADSLFKHVSCEMDCGKMYLPIDFKEIIIDEPTVDAEPVRRGRWIIKDVPSWSITPYKCSACGEETFEEDYKYCPRCGARMDGDDDEDD